MSHIACLLLASGLAVFPWLTLTSYTKADWQTWVFVLFVGLGLAIAEKKGELNDRT